MKKLKKTSCPYCSSIKFTHNRTRIGVDYYKCSSCNKEFKRERLRFPNLPNQSQ